MKKFILKYGWCAYLGGAVHALGYPFYTWQFYAVIVPVCILEAMQP